MHEKISSQTSFSAQCFSQAIREMTLAKAIVSFTVTGALLFGTIAFGAEPARSGPQHTYRIGWLSVRDKERIEGAEWLTTFRSEMETLGWNDRNIEYVERWANPGRKPLPGLAAELVAQKVDMIVALDNGSAHAAANATPQIPIVFMAWNPEGTGLVAGLARPGGNATGLSIMANDLYAKELTLLKEAVPGLRKVGILVDSTASNHDFVPTTLRSTSDALGIEQVVIDVNPLDSLDARLNGEIGRGMGAITGATNSGPRTKAILHRVALANRIPLADYALAPPGLLSLEVDWETIIRRSAHYADKILRGAKPRDLAVEQPTKLLLYINVATAKSFGLTIPRSLLLRADKLVD